jgi:hypothetical protein
MKVVKRKGSASTQRTKKMHGSAAEYRLQQLNGTENRRTEKPGNRLLSNNANKRSRGSARPKGQKP